MIWGCSCEALQRLAGATWDNISFQILPNNREVQQGLDMGTDAEALAQLYLTLCKALTACYGWDYLPLRGTAEVTHTEQPAA